MICAIACANAARTPLLVLASNMSIGQEDTEAGIQLGYQQPTTEGLKKYGKRLIIPRRVHEYAGYAFRQLKSGVPRPVHLDFPAEVASATFKDASELEFFHDKSRYRTESRPHPVARRTSPRRVDLIKTARRPIIVSSNGVFYAKAWDALKRRRREGADSGRRVGRDEGAVLGRQPALGQRGAGALASADLVILVGQHCMPTVGEFAFGPDAKYIRIDQAAEDIGRNMPDRSRHRQLRAGGARGAGRCGAADDARRVGRRDRRGAEEVRGSERSSTTRPALELHATPCIRR